MTENRTLAAAFAASHPNETAALIENFSAQESAEFLSALDAEAAAAILMEMSPARASGCLDEMSVEDASSRMNGLAPRHSATLLRRMSAVRRDQILAALHGTRRVQVSLILRQPHLSVGAWMDSSVAPIRISTPAADTRKKLTESPSSATHLFVVDDQQKFLGRLPLGAIHSAPDDVTIERLFTPGGPSLRAGMEVAAAVEDPAWKDFDDLPVVDRTGKFVGAIRYAALRQALAAPEALKIGAARPPGVSAMDFADLWYIGMARIMDTSLSRRQFPDAVNGKDPA